MHPECVRLVPEFASLTSEEMLFVVLCEDYYSPHHQFPQEDRQRRAKNQVFKNQNIRPWENAKIKKAIDEYRALQYNAKQEQRRIYQNKINIVTQDIELTNEPSKLKVLIMAVKELRKNIVELDEEIYKELEAERNIEGGGRLSFLERIMANRESYKEMIEKRNGRVTAGIS